MATKQRLAHDIENLEKHKTTQITGKTNTLGSKLVPSRRPALGDRTNREAPKQITVKPTLQKPVTTVPNVKPKPVLQKPTQIKPQAIATKVVKDTEKQKEKPIHPVLQKKPTKQIEAYSANHFGLVEEHDTDPLLVPCYVNDIVAYIRTLELEFIVKDNFLSLHKTTPKMRSVLVNWLVEVHANFKLVQETLYLSISIVDRYLQKNKSVGRENLQLVGIVALYIASKYEEIYPPEVCDLVYVCDDIFSKKKIFQMERSMIKTLGFKFGSPSALHFLRRYSKVAQVESNHHILAKYLIELVLIEHDYSSIKPSLVAAAAICLSIRLLNGDELNDRSINIIEHVSGYKQNDLAPVTRNLAKSILKAETSKYQAVRSKYSSSSFCFISYRTELKNGLITKLAEL